MELHVYYFAHKGGGPAKTDVTSMHVTLTVKCLTSTSSGLRMVAGAARMQGWWKQGSSSLCVLPPALWRWENGVGKRPRPREPRATPWGLLDMVAGPSGVCTPPAAAASAHLPGQLACPRKCVSEHHLLAHSPAQFWANTGSEIPFALG